METEFYKIITAISQFLEGLFFGFCIFTLLALIVLFFYKKEELKIFISYSVLVARNLALLYFLFYTISIVIYFASKEFEVFEGRATGPYAWAYWMMLLRPLVFCGLLQLFWIKKMVSKMRYVPLIIFFVLIMLLCSGVILEKFIIITTSYHRDYLPSDYSFNSNIILSIILYVFKFGILFNALVFISLVIRKEPKFK